MNNFIPTLLKRLFTAILLTTLSLNIHAAFFKKIPTVVENPDGTNIHCFSSGDEFFNYLHDKDGYTIIRGDDGFFYYGITDGNFVIPSEHRVNTVSPKSIGLKPNALISEKEYKRRVESFWKEVPKNHSKAPHTGDMNNIVIYIRFSDDEEFTTQRSVYDNRLNNVEGPSLKHYFEEVSYNHLSIESSHYPEAELTTNISYQDSQPRSYFQPYDETSNPDGYQEDEERTTREHNLLKRAVEFVEEEIPQNLVIDADDDGLVDNVCFIINGNAEGWSDLLWAHRWVLYSEYVYIHGKRVWDYTFQPENQTSTYVLAHEMFHTLGAPDLYRYSHDGFTPAGPWDLMGSGFVHMGAFMKHKYANGNWINNIPTISEPGEYSLNPLSSSGNNAYKIESPNSSSEYFVVEYRKKNGLYESNIPQSGLLVYRINTSAGDGNAQAPPDEVYIYRPGGTNPTTNGNINTAAYSNDYGRTEISDNTSPSSFLSNGNAGGLELSNISGAGETISFVLFGSQWDDDKPESISAYAVDEGTINVSWEKNSSNHDVLVAFSKESEFGNPEDATEYSVGQELPSGGEVIYMGDDIEFAHEMLDNNTTYYYKIWSVLNGNNYSMSIETQTTTFCKIEQGSISENFNNASTLPECWETFSNNENDFSWQVGSFSNGLINTNGNYLYLDASSYGTNAEINVDIVTPTIDLSEVDDVNLSFNHYYRNKNGSVALLYYSLNNGESWEVINSWESSTNTEEYFLTNLPELANEPRVILKWKFVGNNGGYYWSVDNISLSLTTNTNLSDYSSLSIYPNPFTNNIFIEGSKDITKVTISNMLGQPILSVPVGNKKHIDINSSDLTKGLYIITIIYRDGLIQSRKIIKE